MQSKYIYILVSVIIVIYLISNKVFSIEMPTIDKKGELQYFDIGDFVLDNGSILPDTQLAYTVHGNLNKAKDNAILVTTWYGDDHTTMEELFIGPDKALDPKEYFIIVANQLSNGVSKNSTSIRGNYAEPTKIGITDDVRAQYKLVKEVYKIDKLELVIGGSMGAQQVWGWVINYPTMVNKAVPIAGAPVNSDITAIIVQSLRDSITSDPSYDQGNYTLGKEVSRGLNRHADLWAILGLSHSFYDDKLYKEIGYENYIDFVEEVRASFRTKDPNSLITMLDKWAMFSLFNKSLELSKKLPSIESEVHLIAIRTDQLFTPHALRTFNDLIPNSNFYLIDSDYGHLALAGLDEQFYHKLNLLIRQLIKADKSTINNDI